MKIWGCKAQWLAYLLLDPAALGSIPNVLKKISEETFSMLRRLINLVLVRKSGQWLKIVDRTHLLLASGKYYKKLGVVSDCSLSHNREVVASNPCLSAEVLCI